jgi:hypothetical protein
MAKFYRITKEQQRARDQAGGITTASVNLLRTHVG